VAADDPDAFDAALIEAVRKVVSAGSIGEPGKQN
jgi:hypothetical protein